MEPKLFLTFVGVILTVINVLVWQSSFQYVKYSLILLHVVFVVLFIVTPKEDELILPKRGDGSKRYPSGKAQSTSVLHQNFDLVVVGSGSGGLSCAALQSRLGKKCLVLEQHETCVGGGTHMFTLSTNTKYRFDSGLHYTVPYSQELLWAVAGGPVAPVLFDRMDEGDGCFDKIVVGEEKCAPFRFKANEAHLPDLYAMFPAEKNDIDEFIRISNKVLVAIPFYFVSKFLPVSLQRIFMKLFAWWFGKYIAKTGHEVLTEVTKNPKLRAILAGQWMNTGSKLEVGSFLMTAAIFRGFSQVGGAYPRGGPEQMPRALVARIKAGGGMVYNRAKVSRILTGPDHTCVGVEMEDGFVIKCGTVVSAIGYTNTYGKLLDTKVFQSLKMPLQPLPNSAGFLMVNVGIDGSPEELDVGVANVWYNPATGAKGDDTLAALEQYFSNPLSQEAPLLITFPSMKDKDWPHKDKTCCQILTMAEYSWFKDHANEPAGNRSEAYQALKSKWEANFLRILIRLFPKMENRVEVSDVSTPLSIEHYLRDADGAACGLGVTPARFLDPEINCHLNMRTPISGLWLTGQDTLLCGVPLAQMSGVITGLRIGGFTGAIRLMMKSFKSIVLH
jgi:all-trans-retinol 13,14-reductase